VTAPKVVAKAPVKTVVKAKGRYAKYEGVVLRRGSKGSVVKVLQSALRVGADGKFGQVTEAKVRAFQKAHRLSQSGVVTAPVWRAFS
jgi:peptidoglycan hydrolase-like protein with peptidoglycan-binding domain